MGTFADTIRPFWLPGLNDVTGSPGIKLQTWLQLGRYQIYTPVAATKFELAIGDKMPFLEAFACDSTRMCAASIETLQGIAREVALPRSTAWFIIRLYYAAFYAAHATLRFLGVSCSQLEASEISVMQKIADAYGQLGGVKVSAGFYKCSFQRTNKSAIFDKLDTAKSGSHENMWKVYRVKISDISTSILQGHGLSLDKQQVASKLTELYYVLGSTGAWLSQVRNYTTYRHDFGTWYPYRTYKDYYPRLFDIIPKWLDDPLSINIWSGSDRALQVFSEICILIISIMREIAVDMASRCSSGTSFQITGTMNLLNQIKRISPTFWVD